MSDQPVIRKCEETDNPRRYADIYFITGEIPLALKKLVRLIARGYYQPTQIAVLDVLSMYPWYSINTALRLCEITTKISVSEKKTYLMY